MNPSFKVTAEHLRRLACLYVRQSTLRQVHENCESTARQYDLKRRAQALGWTTDQIIVIDEDLGLSGATATDRNGFQRLVVEVGLGRVGVVMGLEVSRLARNSTDWHRLLEICALADTLILDEDGIYDPSHFNDRLLLGLKGTMSEAELHLLRARLHWWAAQQSAARRFVDETAAGYVYDDSEADRFRSGPAGTTSRASLVRDLSPHRFRDACCSSLQDGGRSLASTYQQGSARRSSYCLVPWSTAVCWAFCTTPATQELSSTGEPASAKCASEGSFATVA